jgi:hypothetical protein
MRVSFYFERSCPEQRPRAALKPQEPKSPTRAGPGPRAPPPRSSRVVGSWSWGRGKWQAAGAIFVVGKAVLTLHPPLGLGPLSHNANPRDGAQKTLDAVPSPLALAETRQHPLLATRTSAVATTTCPDYLHSHTRGRCAHRPRPCRSMCV